MAWIAVVMSLIGIVGYLGLDSTGSYTVILILVGLAGLGSALYHPQASVMVPQLSGDYKGFGMSLFSLVALPLIGALMALALPGKMLPERCYLRDAT